MYIQELILNFDQEEDDLFQYIISWFCECFNSIVLEIILDEEVELLEIEVIVIVFKIGDKKKLLEFSQKNVKYYQF